MFRFPKRLVKWGTWQKNKFGRNPPFSVQFVQKISAQVFSPEKKKHRKPKKNGFEVARYELRADNSAAATWVLPTLPEVVVTSLLTFPLVSIQVEAV